MPVVFSRLLIFLLAKLANKKINVDLSNLVQWLRANEITLNVKKTVIIIFQSPQKQIYTVTTKMNFHLNGHLNRALNRANSILAKLRHV